MSSAQATRNSTAASLELPSVIFMKLMYLSWEFALITGYWHLAWMMYGCNILSATIWEWPRLSVLLSLGGHNLEISARERPVRQHNAWEGEVSGRMNVFFEFEFVSFHKLQNSSQFRGNQETLQPVKLSKIP